MNVKIKLKQLTPIKIFSFNIINWTLAEIKKMDTKVKKPATEYITQEQI